MMRMALAFTLLSSVAGAALADPGHSTLARTFAEWLHLLLSPDHFPTTISVVLLGICLAIAAAIRQLRKERRDDSR